MLVRLALQIRYQRTMGGLNITTFVKESRTGSDFYAVNVAPYYNASLFCSTWLRGMCHRTVHDESTADHEPLSF